MRRQLFFALILALLVQLSGCAGKQASPPPLEKPATKKSAVIKDPAGPIPAPSLPPRMASASGGSPAPAKASEAAVPYTVDCSVANGTKNSPPATAQPTAKTSGKAAPQPDGSELVSAFTKSSQLCRLVETPPASLTGLEQRLSVSLQEGRDILHSYGYYAGTVSGYLDGSGTDRAAPVVVRVIFSPGPRYAVGRTRIRENRPLDRKATAAQAGTAVSREEAPPALPVSLADVKLPTGAPAIASDVLAAVDRVLDAYHDSGYPFAAVASTRYTVDHDQRTLEADLLVNTGDFVRMGKLVPQGAPTVRSEFVESMRTWKLGQPWSQSRVEALQESLRQTGLFQRIDVRPADTATDGDTRAVDVSLQSAPERTVSGSLKYHSDFGPGLQAYWEHRNLTGRGDRLRVEAPIWADMQELTASYRLPFFLRDDQSFLAKAGVLNQDLDAYDLQSAAASAGIERRFSNIWSGSAMVSAEGGSIKEPEKPRREYVMYGLPLSLTYNTTNSLLDATKGVRLMCSLAPYTGEFSGPFSVLRSRLDAHAFLSLASEERLLLALRGAFGAVAGATAAQVPPSVRFYSGGGGSVRGYAYQSLGPRDADKKALGGNVLTETSAELRWKITPEWGVVAFLDGGTVVDEPLKNPNMDMRWGAGIGVRYYTAIGPVRFDLATPLNPRDDDEPVQFYISIGQSF